ncbi:hypothetical protein COTS27_01108 [Spirochaetota bacterium]|nr:hypothetical protein COTS27_01108 [Spirochaetota bacterium]
MELTLQTILIILGVGFISGFINTISAGGSFITLPVLILLGVPPHVTNASNRVAIVLQSAASCILYYSQNILNVKKSLYLAIPSILGSIIGAYLAVYIDADIFKKLIGVFMIVTIFMMVFKPDRWIATKSRHKHETLSGGEFIVFVGIGMYGGFIQAGVGALLLTGMVLVGHFDLKNANAIKMALSFLFNVSSLTIFLINGLVDWGVGLALAVGSIIGALLGTKISIKGGARFTRWALIITLIGLSGQLLNIW